METKDKIKEAYLGGMTIKEISEEVGLAPSTISYHLKRMGIKTRQGGFKSVDMEKDAEKQLFLFYIERDIMNKIKEREENVSAFIRRAIKEKLGEV